MPVDQRRINGPEVSVPYQIYVDSSTKATKNLDKLLEKRADGRSYDEMRKIYMKTNIISQAKGSAYIEMGKTKVVCSVFDPREIVNKTNYSTQGELFCKFKFAPFSCDKRKIHQQDSEEKQYSTIMQKALESAVCREEFPNFQIDIYAVVLDNDGSALGAAIIAASLALANAGVSMFGIATAVTMGIHGDVTFIDPTAEEETLCMSPNLNNTNGINHGIIMQAMLPQHNQVSEFFFVGSIDSTKLTSVIQLLEKANNDVSPLLQKCLDTFVLRSLKKKQIKIKSKENVNN